LGSPHNLQPLVHVPYDASTAMNPTTSVHLIEAVDNIINEIDEDQREDRAFPVAAPVAVPDEDRDADGASDADTEVLDLTDPNPNGDFVNYVGTRWPRSILKNKGLLQLVVTQALCDQPWVLNTTEEWKKLSSMCLMAPEFKGKRLAGGHVKAVLEGLCEFVKKSSDTYEQRSGQTEDVDSLLLDLEELQEQWVRHASSV
jgi:hypothetical protein